MESSKILIIDDDPSILELCRFFLEDASFHITTAREHQKALELLSQNHYDLILMDLMMPGLSGEDFLKKLSSLMGENKIPLVLMSAKKEEEIDDLLQKGLADAFLGKPISRERLLNCVQNILVSYYSKENKKNDIP